MPIVNNQVKFLTSQYIGTCKSAYTRGYALNWVLTNANIEGNKNDVSQGDCSVTTSGKTNKWPKANIINAIITATIGVIGLLFTYIINKSAIDSWVSNLFWAIFFREIRFLFDKIIIRVITIVR